MSKTYPYIISNDTVTVYIDGRPQTAHADHPNFEEIKAALLYAEYDNIPNLFDLVGAIGVTRQETGSGVEFNPTTGTLTYDGWPIGGVIVDRVLELSRQGVKAPVDRLLNFLENLYQNPSSSVVERLYTFLEKGNMPITDDGHFLAYKRIRADWTDVHSGTMDNSVGTEVTMPRSLVNDNDNETCSTGLHFCSYSYLASFSGDRVVALKINPRDVVSIPTDYNDAKGRACRYVVMEEITERAKDGPVWGNDDWIVSTAPTSILDEPEWPFEHQKLITVTGILKTDQLLAVEEILNGLSGPELVEVYNRLCYTGGEVSRFRDRATGIRRILISFDLDEIEEELDALGFN